MRENLRGMDFSDFEKSDERMFAQINEVLHRDLPRLLKTMQIQKVLVSSNPFAKSDWDIEETALEAYYQIFQSLEPVNGSLSGSVARDTLMKTGIPIEFLRKIWELSDFEKDGKLDKEEFALALHLAETVKTGHKVPDTLPPTLIPPSKRKGGGGDGRV
eukprot:TRINITY_DN10129_c0_g1_i1.p2 TRINITY_DN10129_c0_g1~~TRINITY_DN10129_c0_g1_i1.p2  ORF type:complete len:159 (+),score=49.72 TRINITY_DN10129_c0_g1_i1:1319-1795(+)